MDVLTIERLANKLEEDAASFHALNPGAMRSIADILRATIGAPLAWPSRVAGAAYADEMFRGSNSHRSAFNWGVKWAVEHYEPTVQVVERWPRTETAQHEPNADAPEVNKNGA